MTGDLNGNAQLLKFFQGSDEGSSWRSDIILEGLQHVLAFGWRLIEWASISIRTYINGSYPGR